MAATLRGLVSLPRSGDIFGMHEPDLNDGRPWSEMDIADLKNAIADGATLAETARFLCRSGSLYDVAMKAKALGLKWHNSF